MCIDVLDRFSKTVCMYGMYVCMYVLSDNSPARKAGIQGSRSSSSSSSGSGTKDVVDFTLGDIIIGTY